MMIASGQPACRFFQQNSCRKGDSCQFYHPTTTTPSATPGPTTTAPRTYRAPPSFTALGNTNQGRPTVATQCRFWSKFGSCKNHGNCPFLHDTASATGASPPETLVSARRPIECSFWKQGHCVRGDKCNFRHEVVAMQAQITNHTASEASSWRIPNPKTGSVNRQTCSYWKAGKCRHGDACHNDHFWPTVDNIKDSSTSLSPVPLLVASPPRHPPVTLSTMENVVKQTTITLSDPSANGSFDSNSFTKLFGRTLVLFSSGAAITSIVPSSESSRLVISNLPSGFTKQRLDELLEAFTDVVSSGLRISSREETIGKQVDRVEAVIDFSDQEEAQRAWEALEGREEDGNRLLCRMDRVEAKTGGSISCKTVKVSWHAPACLAFANYPSRSMAQRKAASLNGLLYEGRALSASIHRQNPLAVVIKNLPVDASMYALERIAGTDEVFFKHPDLDEEDAETQIQELLEDISPVVSFRLQNCQGNAKMCKAIVRFRDSEGASAAVKTLHGQNVGFLANRRLFVELLLSASFSILSFQYIAISPQITSLQKQLNANQSLGQIYVYHPPGQPNVTVTVSGTNAKGFLTARKRIAALLAGERVVDHDGNAEWDDFFSSDAGLSFIKDVNAETGAVLRRDPRNRMLVLHGGQESKERARIRVKERLVQLRQFIGPLDSVIWRTLLSGGFDEIKQQVGEEKLVLDVTARSVFIRGSKDDYEAVRLFIASCRIKIALTPPTVKILSAVQSSQECPICLCEASSPMPLPCGHSYCAACLKHALLSALDTRTFPVRCAQTEGDHPCIQLVPLSIVRQILSGNDQVDKLLEAAYKTHIHRHPHQFRYCPTADCEEIYRPLSAERVIRCSSCFLEICTACHVENHEGLTCEEFTEVNDTSPDAMAFKRFKKENDIKPCPHCKAQIFKDGGCNHVTCGSCKTHVCWVCMTMFSIGSEVYEHMRTAHGGIGI